jgi:NADH-quinone oxidoreductase subunit M
LWVRAFSGLVGHETVASLLLLLGFAVKIPLWPCSSWLLKAHVEASTEFSILLSGFLVKFGVIGLYRSLTLSGYSEVAFTALRTMAWVGIFESAVRLYQQVDLKRLIATLTVLETNWLVLCLCGDSMRSVGLGVALVLVHC